MSVERERLSRYSSKWVSFFSFLSFCSASNNRLQGLGTAFLQNYNSYLLFDNGWNHDNLYTVPLILDWLTVLLLATNHLHEVLDWIQYVGLPAQFQWSRARRALCTRSLSNHFMVDAALRADSLRSLRSVEASRTPRVPAQGRNWNRGTTL